MMELVKQIEEMSMNAHPALNTMLYDGWLLRFGERYTDRANSVNILTQSTISVEEKIRYCEQKYKEQSLATTFKITPLSLDLDSYLEKDGYQKNSLTDLMILDGINLTCNDTETMIFEGVSEAWARNYFSLNEVSADHADTARKIFQNVLPATYTATICQGSTVVACGRSVIEHGYVSLYNIIVSKEHRRCGYGRNLCEALLSHAFLHGAHQGYIQVVASNEKAKNLYKQLGFTTLYQYWYRKKQ